MNLFDVYPLFNIEIVQGKGCHVWDSEGNEYLDLYGGHARSEERRVGKECRSRWSPYH